MRIIAGIYRNQLLQTPKGEQTRPTASRLRESLFNICQNYIDEASFLDAFAGSGAIGFEALSRGAKHVVFIEKNKEAIRCLQKNAETLGVMSQCQILHGDVFQFLQLFQKQKKQFDIIYADPPYNTKDLQSIIYSEKIIRLVDTGPLLTPKGSLFIEEAIEAQPTIQDLHTLYLKKARKMGTSILQEYELQSECR